MSQHGVLVLGELLFDIFVDPAGSEYDRKAGGAPANLACHLRDHLRGLGPVYLASAIGPVGEANGDKLQDLLAERGVDLSLLQRHQTAPTGTVHVHHHDPENPYTIFPGAAFDQIARTDELISIAKGSSVICFGSLIRRSDASAQTLNEILEASNALHVCDINLRRNCFSRETIEACLSQTDILKLNEKEVGDVGELFGWGVLSPKDFFERVSSAYRVRSMIVTQGERGVTAFSVNGVELQVPGFPIKEVDVTGAGDAFTAMFVAKLVGDPRFEDVTCLGPHLHAIAESHLQECCVWANALGALVAGRMGGMTRVEPEEVAALVAGRSVLPKIDAGLASTAGKRTNERPLSP